MASGSQGDLRPDAQDKLRDLLTKIEEVDDEDVDDNVGEFERQARMLRKRRREKSWEMR